MAADTPQTDVYGRREPTSNEKIINTAIGIVLIILGIGSFAALVSSIVGNQNIERAIEGPEYIGLGADVRLVEPQESVINAPHLSLDIASRSPADQAGLEDNDALVSVGGTDIGADAYTVEDIQGLFNSAFRDAVAAGESTIPVTVYRDGETITVDLPVPEDLPADLFELNVPLAVDTEGELGLGLEVQEGIDVPEAYYGLFPESGSPTRAIRPGSRIVAIDGTEITTDMTLEEVQTLVRDEDVPEEEEDYQITLQVEQFVNNRAAPLERTFNKEVAPTLFIGFADELGFIIPILEVVLGIAFIKMGYDLMRFRIGAARWALVAFLWMSAGLVVVFFGVLWIQGKGGDVLNDQPFDLFEGLAAAWFYLVPLILFIPAFRWLGPRQSIIYEGEEPLGVRNTRFAWTLLIPTLAVLVVVAARPLEQTFIKSLTDDVFADARPADFVGLKNYQQLLTFQPVIVDCRIDGRYMVTSVQDESPAAQAGFAEGDVFLSIAGEDVEDAVSERSEYEVRTNEDGVGDEFVADGLTDKEEITRPFNEAFSDLVSAAVDEGDTVEFEVSRPEADGDGRDDVDLEVEAAAVTDSSPGAFGLSTEFEGGCARAPGGKRAIQWTRTELEDRRGDERYEQALAYSLPGSDTAGLKIVAKDPEFVNSVVNTVRFTLTTVVLELIIGMIIALVVNSNFAGRGIMRAAMLVPWSIPTVVAATLWQVMLRPDNTGIINKFLVDIGMLDRPQQWLTDLGPWMNSIIAVDVWKTSPFMALLILAGLQTIPGDIYEAAAVDGANRLRQFISITLPLLRPTIAVALIFRTLDALRAFDVFQVLLDPTRPSMATYNYSTMVDGQREVGYASAVGVLIFIFILIFTILYVRFVGIETDE